MNFKLPTQRLKNNQVFEICDIDPYYVTYEQLKKIGPAKMVHLVQLHYSQPYTCNLLKEWNNNKPIYEKTTLSPEQFTEEELDELKDYFEAFIKDIDEHFKIKNFFMHEWYYPIRNKIIWRLRKLRKRK
jgi:hypothetical protein